ncbi:AddA family double-strand break repair helicase subunit A N-terminal domain protein [Candidatus Cyrtobacter comes]|uniref:DNA 3'-5' helicase n=1 Tax=Candidatus Cyrtobacter comes TaxID=675776 RepID=A0ABU5L8N8_9RICK|nr:UvrD-helicase domain-containing protein [Candidatus Cyrtobacter comes]MDZ5762397.1 AddA family double-strand break repair helicase subunit A N-terminal domain protein [Candidatus Cyrtobacter comes]
MNINKEQIRASDPHACVYVSASAGTGKTKILIDRLVRILILGKSPLKNILCITFTQSAALEVKKRLINKMHLFFQCSYEQLISELFSIFGREPQDWEIDNARRLYTNFLLAPNLKIGTLHSFCLDLLTRFSEKNFKKIINNAEQKRIIICSIYKIISHQSYIKDEEFFLYVKDLVEHSDLITPILNSSFEEHKCELEKMFGIKLLKKRQLLTDFYKNIRVNDIIDAYNIVAKCEGGHISEALRYLQNGGFKKSFAKYAKIFLTKSGEPRKNFLKSATVNLYPDESSIINEHKEEVLKYFAHINALEAGLVNLRLSYLGLKALKLYENQKIAEGFISYADILNDAYELLTQSEISAWVRMIIDQEVDHVLIDEAQDLNTIQWSIIKSITEEFFSGDSARQTERTVFIIGDYKQSIFGFQGAEPEIFKNAYFYYKNATIHSRKKWVEINLNCSYRSAQEILDFTNTYISSGLIGCNYEEQKASNKDFSGKIEEVSIGYKKLDTDSWLIPGLVEYRDKNDQIAYIILEKVKEMIMKDHVSAEEIMILFRKRSILQQKIINLFISDNIPIFLYGSNKLEDYLIIKGFVATLKFIIKPHDELSLMSMLKSKIFDLSEESIFEIYTKGFFNNLEKYNKALISELNALIKYAENKSVYDILIFLLLKAQSRLDLFEKKLLLAFLNIARDFEKLGRAGIASFIRWFYDLESIYKDEILRESAVKIMTIHASKGMESDAVILADFCDITKIVQPKSIWVNYYKLIHLKNLRSIDKINLELESLKYTDSLESTRLLYVALTRARKYLFICKNE